MASSNKPIHSCNYCGLLLSSANALMEHKRIHTGDRPFSCHVCNKRFTQKAHLNIHKRTHTGEKPYACHICHKRFAQSSHLSSHKRIHTGEKPFVCGICHIGFTQKQRLDAHLRKHMERPGQEIVVRQRLVANTSTSQYRKISSSIDNDSFKLTIGQKMSSNKSNIKSPSSSETKTVAVSDGQHSPRAIVKNEPKDAPEDSNDMNSIENSIENSMPNSGNDPEASAQSFSSEGMFLHPSGYVTFGRADMKDVNLGSDATSAANQSHRRKPIVVRKHCSEPAAKPDSSTGVLKTAKEEAEVGGISDNHVVMGDKVVPTYMEDKVIGIQRVTTRSNNRKVVKENLPKVQLPAANDNSKGKHDKVHEQNQTDLAQVNNRISLVNFTAEELVAHMMKREDVNKCPFCCLIFQDAAMYHIHRYMHDKAELARCNTCGKLLQDKYDFTAHFLSTHQS